MPSRVLRRLMDRVLIPWYDRDKAAAEQAAATEREVHTEDIRQRSIAARISAEKVRQDYAAMSRRLER